MINFCSNCDTPFALSRERAKQLPVSSSHESFLLRGLQSGYPFLRKWASESLRGILHESFHPASDASSFSEGKDGGLVQDGLEMITWLVRVKDGRLGNLVTDRLCRYF
jgi:hypothetical protein